MHSSLCKARHETREISPQTFHCRKGRFHFIEQTAPNCRYTPSAGHAPKKVKVIIILTKIGNLNTITGLACFLLTLNLNQLLKGRKKKINTEKTNANTPIGFLGILRKIV